MFQQWVEAVDVRQLFRCGKKAHDVKEALSDAPKEPALA